MNRLGGKIALVTGGAKGQGEAIAKLFSSEGATVVISDILEEGKSVVEEIRVLNREAQFIKMDVSNSKDWNIAINKINDDYGKLDILVNNAGVSGRKDIANLSEEEWNYVIDTNAKSVFLGMKSGFMLMKKNKTGGAIINNSSIWGIVGSGGSAAYHGAKGAVTLLTKTAAVEFAKYNIRVNSIHPGVIQTPMTKELLASNQGQNLIKNTPIGRPGEPIEVANAVLFLASDESTYITGVSLPIDGGYTAH